jgi:hypothetical protein
VPGDHVDDRGRNEKWRDLARALRGLERLEFRFDRREAANARARDDTATTGVLRRKIETGVLHGLHTCGHPVMDELVHAPRFLRAHVGVDIEASHGAADAGCELGGVETRDEPDAALATQDAVPRGRYGAAHRGDDA